MRWYKEIFYFAWHFGLRAMWEIAICPRLFKSQARSNGILSFLERVSEERMNELRSKTLKQELGDLSEECNIWVCWLQGEANMPSTIKMCYDSLLRNKGRHKVILITNDNLNDYVSLPEHIISKHDNGIISNPHYSDIIRCYLLWKYGGIWIDAAIFVLNRIEVKKGFFTLRISDVKSFNIKWAIQYMMSEKGFYLFDFLYEYLVEYWRLYNKPIDYLLLDYVFELAYRNNSDIKRIIDEIPLNNTDLHRSRYLFNEKCDENVFQQFIQNNTFLSLTWRFNYDTITKDGALTYYGRLLQEFEDKKNNH